MTGAIFVFVIEVALIDQLCEVDFGDDETSCRCAVDELVISDPEDASFIVCDISGCAVGLWNTDAPEVCSAVVSLTRFALF